MEIGGPASKRVRDDLFSDELKMRSDTTLGGQQEQFPTTQHSAVVGVSSPDQQLRARALDTLVTVYWRPVYKYLRLKWNSSNEEAKDLTQEFFAKCIEKGYFESYDPGKAAFRTFLRVCLDGFVNNARKAERAQKRGGGAAHVSLDFAAAEAELAMQRASPNADLDEFYQREWMRSVMSLAIEALRVKLIGANKAGDFEMFCKFHLHEGDAAARPSHADLAKTSGLTITQVNNHLAATRRLFRTLLLETLAAASGSAAELRDDARTLFQLDERTP